MEIKPLRLPTVVGVGALLLFSHPSPAQKMTSTQPIPTGDPGSATSIPVRQSATSAQGDAIRPFKVQVPDAALMDLKRRVNATRWPDKETVADRSQGAQLANLQELLRYWGTSYDWRRVESRLNSYPNFITTIDGVDIQFIQVKSKEKNALPLIVTHGWPGSVIEQLKIIDPLTNPTAHGGGATDAFDVVIPSIPGYGFSGKPSDGGWDPARVARAWAVLMKRLGYTRYVAQGGDWGSVISDELARQAPPGLLGIHINLAQAIPPDVEAGLATGMVPPGASEEERATFNILAAGRASGGSAYFAMMTARPQTLGYGQADSPAGLASWILVHPGFGAWKFGNDPAQTLTKDDVLDNITLYWLTNTAASSGRLYWENKGKNALSSAAWKTNEITLPVATTVFGEDAYRPPESWARRAFPKLIYYNKVPKGGHFAAWEQPELFASELRAAFRSLR
jgi:pimeloyl-ACP methyl ester carboxylesterase